LSQGCALGVTVTIQGVVVDHASGLHERIANGWADEPKTAALEVLAHCLRLGGFGRYFG
jgi:hypothetical protein